MRSRPTLAGEKNALPGADTIPQSPRGQPWKARLSFSRVNSAAAMSTWPPACPSPAPHGASRAHVALRDQWGASGRAARLVPEGAPCAGLRVVSVFPAGWPASVVAGPAPRCTEAPVASRSGAPPSPAAGPGARDCGVRRADGPRPAPGRPLTRRLSGAGCGGRSRSHGPAGT